MEGNSDKARSERAPFPKVNLVGSIEDGQAPNMKKYMTDCVELLSEGKSKRQLCAGWKKPTLNSVIVLNYRPEKKAVIPQSSRRKVISKNGTVMLSLVKD